jgi:two-component system, cell cycle sensor histidine kinase and response regulator CckA
VLFFHPPGRRSDEHVVLLPTRHALGGGAVRLTALTVTYLLAAEIGLRLSLAPGQVSSLWPAAGVALAFLWRLGPRYAPGVFLGTVLASLHGGYDPRLALAFGVGNTLAALVGVHLLRSLPDFHSTLDRLGDVLGLTFASALAPIVSATVGVVAISALQVYPAPSIERQWLTYWSGEVLGTLVAAPLVMVWLRRPYWRRASPAVLGEIVILALVLVGVTWTVYVRGLPRPSLIYPILMWAALRFDVRGATAAAVTVATIAATATLAGLGPLVAPEPLQTTASLQIVLAVTVVMGLVIGSVTAERQRALGAWQAATEDLRAVFNAAPLAIVATDERCRIIRWNEGAERMFGWTRAEVVGKPLPYIPEDRQPEYDALVDRQERGEAIVGYETVRRHKDGHRIHVSLSLAGIRDARGRLTGSMAVLEDIGVRRAEQERLRESEARLYTALESLPFEFWIRDDQGRYVVQNSASTRRLGRRIGAPPAPPDAFAVSHEAWMESERRAFAGEVVHGEVAYALPDGPRHYYSVQAPILNDGAVTGVLGCNIDITERKRAEAALARQKEILQTIFDHVPAMICFLDAAGEFQWVNRGWRERLGWSLEEMAGRDMMAEFYPDPRHRTQMLDLMRVADSQWNDCRTRVRRGETVDAAWAFVRLSDGTTIGIGQDVSERKSAERALRMSEAQLRQSQKMEAVGRLAGGVAHDFNNLLTSILGHTELMLDELPGDHALRADLGEIRHAAERAADLTTQLLAFSRKQVIEPRILDLNETIGRIAGMLRRLIGEHIELATALEPTLGRVLADSGQLEQVLVNLVVNARDAMPEGGRLRIETANVVLDAAFAREHEGAHPGPYVMLAVIDEGAGIDPEIQPHIFEPFFTTKDKAKGTGLGLATVYGIVKQSGGYVTVESAQERGTTMRVHLPLAVVTSLPAAAAQEERATKGSETILLVEDEDSVRGLARRILARAGYTVLTARDADEATRVSAQYEDPIELLLTDVIMAGLSGPRLAEALIRLRPELGVLFMSGYNEDTIIRQGVLRQGVAYLQKPFTPSGLTGRVREALDERQGRLDAGGRAAG